MNWKYILKNQITDSKQGVLTSDAPLPKKKKKINDCKKQLEKWLGNAVLIKEKYGLGDANPQVHERWYELPESTACKALDWFKVPLFTAMPVVFNTVSKIASTDSCAAFICAVLAAMVEAT